MEEKRIVFATGNQDKMREIRMILADLGMPVISMKEAGVSIDIVEDGTSFEENAQIKVEAISKVLPGDIILADDSGLEIDYLDKAPGIYSARYADEYESYDVVNQVLIDKLNGVEGEARSARFVCAIAAAFPNGLRLTVRETMEGRVAHEIAGENGFGYDPILFLPEYGCTSAEISTEEKNKISHRGKALRAMRKMIEKLR